MREVTLEEMLNARDERAEIQKEWIRKYHRPLVSFCMNIAGPIKNSPLIRRAFDEGLTALDEALRSGDDAGIIEMLCRDEHTGCEALYAVNADAAYLKEIAVGIEESSILGRLFDIDVIDAKGNKIERSEERTCIICGAPGKACASRRLHSVEELQVRTKEIITDYFTVEESRRVSDMVSSALAEEVLTTPKPGLVDRSNTGSHKDMDTETFMSSIEALRPFWAECMLTGAKTKEEPPWHTFLKLKKLGIEAEKDMMRATDGANTHKGAIFLMGILCGAIGRCYDPLNTPVSPEALADECRAMTEDVLKKELAEIGAKKDDQMTSGERAWKSCGIKGARGEMSEGLPGVIGCGLPEFEKQLKMGHCRNDAGAAALISIISRGPDTNMIARGGYEQACRASRAAAELVREKRHTDMSRIKELDDCFIEMNLSPGGSADLLAVTYFIYDYCRRA